VGQIQSKTQFWIGSAFVVIGAFLWGLSDSHVGPEIRFSVPYFEDRFGLVLISVGTLEMAQSLRKRRTTTANP